MKRERIVRPFYIYLYISRWTKPAGNGPRSSSSPHFFPPYTALLCDFFSIRQDQFRSLLFVFILYLLVLFLLIRFLQILGIADGQESILVSENERRLSSQLANVAEPLPLTAENEDYIGVHQVDDGGLTDMAINLAERSPRFEDPSGHTNVTVQLGGTAFLNCRVLDLQDKTVIINKLCVSLLRLNLHCSSKHVVTATCNDFC